MRIRDLGISDRRSFLKSAGAACLASTMAPSYSLAQSPMKTPPHAPRLGTVSKVGATGSAEATIKHVHDLGLPTCQIFFEHLTLDQVQPRYKQR
jgi:L-ribulose-5-phosphate 3-epimerase